MTGVSTSPKLTEKDTEWFFRAQGTSALYAKVVGPALKEMGLKRMAFLVINDDWGRGVAKEFGRAFESHGGTVVETLIFDRKEKDLTSYLTKIRSLGVDALERVRLSMLDDWPTDRRRARLRVLAGLG